MNEEQAKKLSEVYKSMGHPAYFWDSGGGVFLVTVYNESDPETLTNFGIDTVTQYRHSTDNSETIYLRKET